MEYGYLVGSVIWSLFGFAAGYMFAELTRKIDTIKETVVDEVKTVEYTGPDRRARGRRFRRVDTFVTGRWFGIIIIMLSLLTVVQTAVITDRQRQLNRCLADYNAAVVRTQQARAEIADKDRRALVVMVTSVLGGKTSAQVTKALDTYVETIAKNDAERTANPLPEPVVQEICNKDK